MDEVGPEAVEMMKKVRKHFLSSDCLADGPAGPQIKQALDPGHILNPDKVIQFGEDY